MGGAGIAWLMFTGIGSFTDPDSSLYIQDPIACSFLAAFVAGYVGYGFFSVLEDGMDTLLYYYAQNKKHNKKLCRRYMPDELEEVVGREHLHADAYPYYGKGVANTMYLNRFLSQIKPAAAPKKTAAAAAVSKARDVAAYPGAGAAPAAAGYPTSYDQ